MKNQKKTSLKTELEHVYVTSDNKKFLDREIALIHELEIVENKDNKIKEDEMDININNLFLKLLANNDWGLYFKKEPLQSLPVQDGHKMYKINEVSIDSLHEAVMKEIENERQSDKWENNNSSQNLENSME